MKSGKEVARSLNKGVQSFALFLCNPKQCTILNRKPLSWVTHVVIDEKVPYLTGAECFLDGNPGLVFLPKVELPYESQISYTFNISNHKAYAKASEEILSKYQNLPSNCNFESNIRFDGKYDEACNFPPHLLGPCQEPQLLAENGGFCIYLKMNKIFGYLPDISGEKILIECFVAKNGSKTLDGDITFYPSTNYENKNVGYFSTVAFPYLNQKDFQSPLLAIHFQAPNKTTPYKCKYANMPINEEYEFTLSV